MIQINKEYLAKWYSRILILYFIDYSSKEIGEDSQVYMNIWTFKKQNILLESVSISRELKSESFQKLLKFTNVFFKVNNWFSL